MKKNTMNNKFKIIIILDINTITFKIENMEHGEMFLLKDGIVSSVAEVNGNDVSPQIGKRKIQLKNTMCEKESDKSMLRKINSPTIEVNVQRTINECSFLIRSR